VSSVGWGRLSEIGEGDDVLVGVVNGVMWKKAEMAWVCIIRLIWWVEAVGGLRGVSIIR